jgi:hypothetical protein
MGGDQHHFSCALERLKLESSSPGTPSGLRVLIFVLCAPCILSLIHLHRKAENGREGHHSADKEAETQKV